MNRRDAVVLVAVKAAFGAALAIGLLLSPAHASAATALGGIAADAQRSISDASADPGIVTDGSGQLRDCTVTDSLGVRADWDKACDTYWSEAAGYKDGLNYHLTSNV